jgi:DNA helicase-2/ATP-dependent DNA helicase PcrA
MSPGALPALGDVPTLFDLPAGGPAAAPPLRDLVTPTAEQQAAISFGLQPLRIIAGAGTGKTMVMVERIAHLVAAGQADPEQVLGLTFTNKAAAELKQRVDRRLGGDTDVTVTTYHGFGAGLVADHLLDLDLHPRTRLLNRAEAWQLLFLVFDEFRFDKRRVFRPGLVVNDALALASRCADHLVDIEMVAVDAERMASEGRWKDSRDAAQSRLELCQVVVAYQRQKRRRHLIDFDDQIRLAVSLLRERPDLAGYLAEQRPFVLLDEYQDTNYAQRVLLQLIYQAGSAVTAVGDDMQSIYAFRGAHLRNLLDFGAHFPPLAALALTENRRSGADIVTLANRIQAQVSEAIPKQLTVRGGAPAATVECFLASDDHEEASVIAADVSALGPPWSRHAVLCRKRRLLGAIADALEAASVPVQVVGSSGLLDRPEVIDLVSWLELLADPSSSVALLRILEGPSYRIGHRDLAAVARHVSKVRSQWRDRDEAGTASLDGAGFALIDAIADRASVDGLSPRAHNRLENLVAQWEYLAAAGRRLPLVDLAELVAERGGLWSAVGPLGRDNLDRFLALAQGFQPIDGIPGLAAFVDYLRLVDESEEDLAEAHHGDLDAVTVLTIHQAKGLEWDHVWIPGLAGSKRSKIFPDERGGDNPLSKPAALPWWLCNDDPGFGDWRVDTRDSIDRAVRRRAREEEWRLLYVACTRARHRLVCSAAQWYPGPAEPQGPSEFYTFVAAQSDLVAERFRHEPPAVNPLVTQMQARRDVARMSPAVSSRGPTSASQGRLFDDTTPPREAESPTGISVTDLGSFRRCPLQYYWLAVRPLPRQGSAAAAIGTEVHRWIEQQASGQAPLPGLVEPVPVPVAIDPDGDPDLSAAIEARGLDPAVPGTAVAGLRAAFLATPYATLRPRRVEAPFVLASGGRLIRGRIDALYDRDGFVEIVDFKTGRPPFAGDRGATLQLEAYAVAAVDVWAEDPAKLRTTYCYLRPDGSFTLSEWAWDHRRVSAARADLERDLRRLGDGAWPAAPGPWCQRCEWRQVCKAGGQYLAGSAGPSMGTGRA